MTMTKVKRRGPDVGRQPLNVLLMPPKDWHPIVSEAWSGLDARRERIAGAVLRHMHDRHVGCPPILAADLARVLADARLEIQEDNGWMPVFQRLSLELTHANERGRGSARIGSLLSAQPLYAIIRLTLPILEAACRQVGQSVLFCEDKVARRVPAGRYENYVKNLQRAMRRLCEKTGGGMRLFWKERAMVLVSSARGGRASNVIESGPSDFARFNLPRVQAFSLALLTDMIPSVPPVKAVPRRRANMRLPVPHSRANQRRESGVDGIRISRRDEDLNNVLLSEFVNPGVLLADRLANTGFFALRRQPKQEALQRVSILGAMPFASDSPVAAVIKCAWFEAVHRLAHRLLSASLNQSLFRWFEGVGKDRLREGTFALDRLPIHGDIPALDQRFRHNFLTALGWIPNFLNTGPGQLLPTAPPDLHFGDDWVAAWIRQAGRRAGFDRLGDRERRRAGMVFFNVFLPESLRVPGSPWQEGAVKALRRMLRPEKRFGQHFAVIWYPDQPMTGAWRWESGREELSVGDDVLDLEGLTGQLAADWLNRWTRGIWIG